jgi:hypothetical protein
MDLKSAYIKILERDARKKTRKMVKEAIREGRTQPLTHHAYGPLSQAAYMNIGWSPDTETSLEGYTDLTLHLDIPLLEW